MVFSDLWNNQNRKRNNLKILSKCINLEYLEHTAKCHKGDYREHRVYLMEHKTYLVSKKDRKTTFGIHRF